MGTRGEAELERVVQRAAWGYDDLAYSARETLVLLRDRRYVARTHLVVTHPDRPRDVVGALHLRAPQLGDSHLVEADVLVHPEHRRQGIGTLLLTAAERHARDLGRRLLVVSSDHGPEPDADDAEAVTPPTGSGRIRRTDPFVGLAARRGLTLQQSERYSVLPLPVDPELLARLRTEAERAAGPGYRVMTWQDRYPPEWLEQLAVLVTRMSTDVPRGGVEATEDPWDAQRLLDAQADTRAGGRGSLGAAALHVASRTLVGFTELEYPLDAPAVVFQEDTLVLREHRGHRLGQLMKAANLQALAQVRPTAQRLHTWNAEENSHMLRINVALGFRPAGVSGVWTKPLG